ncbi:MAG: hypothetical protein V3573_02490 [Desulfovibrionaceae bacterium]
MKRTVMRMLAGLLLLSCLGAGSALAEPANLSGLVSLEGDKVLLTDLNEGPVILLGEGVERLAGKTIWAYGELGQNKNGEPTLTVIEAEELVSENQETSTMEPAQ